MPAAALVLAAAPAAAQELHENVAVEGRYKPQIVLRERLDARPLMPELSLTPAPLPYLLDGVEADTGPTAAAMPAMGWRDTRTPSAGRGYVNAGMGSWLDAMLEAGCSLGRPDGVNGGAMLRYRSTSLMRTRLHADSHTRRRDYDATLGLRLAVPTRHGDLSLLASWRFDYLNYYASPAPRTPWQAVNDAAARLAWHSRTRPGSAVAWHAAAALRHAATRDLYLPAAGTGSPARLRGLRESHVSLGASLLTSPSSPSHFGLRLGGDWLIYSGGVGRDAAGMTAAAPLRPDNYGRLSLTPYYAFSRGRLLLHVGAAVDLTFRAGPRGDRSGVLHAAPDVRLDFRTGGFGMYLHLLGGTTLNTLASHLDADSYAMPALASTRPGYSPLDATLGFAFGPFAGFTADLSAHYALRRNVAAGGLYGALLAGALPQAAVQPGHAAAPTPLYNLHGASFAARAAYEHGLLSIDATASWQPQHGHTGWLNGYDRPAVTAGASLRVRPAVGLEIAVSYSYRGHRSVWLPYVVSVPVQGGAVDINGRPSGTRRMLARTPLADLSLLGARVSYRLNGNVTLWISGDNLLDRRHRLLPAMPQEALSLAGGVNWQF